MHLLAEGVARGESVEVVGRGLTEVARYDDAVLVVAAHLVVVRVRVRVGVRGEW